MKKLGIGAILGFLLVLVLAATFKVGILDGFLQDDLNANQQSITNALNLVGAHWGDGTHLSNVTATATTASTRSSKPSISRAS